MFSAVPSPTPAHWNPAQSPSVDRTMNTPPSASPNSPASPTRRLRGLSYLRSYTQNHILSRDSHSGSNNNNTSSQRPASLLARSTSYPAPSSRGSTPTSNPAAQNNPQSPTAQRTPANSAIPDHENSPGISSWSPTVGGGQSESSRPTGPQSTTSSSAILSGNNPLPASTGQIPTMARTRSATTGAALDGAESNEGQETSASDTAVNGDSGHRGMSHQLPCIRFTAHQDPRATRPSLVFASMSRTLPTGKETIKVGRFSERENMPAGLMNIPSAAPIGFKSKVVSRRHCEFWCASGKWYIRDVKSSSGTFLNHIRLSSPGTESRPYQVNDGDIVQLGIDFKGGEEMIFRCVKIRVELNKGWQTGPSQFNVQSHKRLRELNSLNKASGGSSQDCSICLGPVAPCQSLFVAPCSHTWHYKCIRVIINGQNWPHFICPNCRSVADLEADLDEISEEEWEELGEEAKDVVIQPTHADPTTVQISSLLAAPERAPNPVPSEANQGQRLPLADDDMSGVQLSNIPDRETFGVSEDLEMEQPGVSSDIDFEGSDVSESKSSAQYPEFLNPNPNSSKFAATTAPVDIVARKAVGSGSTQIGRHAVRTPSPIGLASSLDVVPGPDGPMTPRNDVGPFIFDGSAGRASAERMVTNSLAAAADTPAEALQHPA